MVKRLVDPNHVDTSSEFGSILSAVALRRLQLSWQHLFRRVILEMMPANALSTHFHEVMGRPTKELYSVAGLLLIKEVMDWTNERAADCYMFDVSIQYALNLQPQQQSMCERTIERYNKLFREDELASQIMQRVTAKLVERLELDVSKQRLDSTHVQSNMATFGRTRLMGVAIKGFLIQLRRIDESLYGELSEELRKRYEPSRHQLFGGWKKDDDWTAHRLTAYGSDDNFCRCKRYGVELAAPVPGKCSEQKASCEVFTETDFPYEDHPCKTATDERATKAAGDRRI